MSIEGIPPLLKGICDIARCFPYQVSRIFHKFVSMKTFKKIVRLRGFFGPAGNMTTSRQPVNQLMGEHERRLPFHNSRSFRVVFG